VLTVLQVVSEFLQQRLVGEGNVLRHLELLGYRLGYAQSPLLEYPFAVSNLAVDLRDGLRLMKVAEVLTGDGSLLQQARYPCDRKPMQLHNTALALEALQRAGVQLQALPTTTGLVALRPEDIVEGDRERTLSLLWAVARTLQLGSMLRLSSLKAEVQRVLARTRMSGRRPLLPLSISSGGPSSSAGRRQQPLAVYMHDELLSTLQEWVQAVCASYDVTVHNFTTCFGDGVVLCLLVSLLASSCGWCACMDT
jgi:abnormal spindle-like microcephaly-associated protein